MTPQEMYERIESERRWDVLTQTQPTAVSPEEMYELENWEVSRKRKTVAIV